MNVEVKPENKKNTASAELIFAILVPVILFPAVYGSDIRNNTALIEHLMRAGIAACLIAAFAAYRLNVTDGYTAALCAVCAMGVIMRTGYMLYTPYQVRGHDVGLPGECGHLDYIMGLMSGRLPASNDYQLSHPPLFHILAAGASNVWRSVSGGAAADMEAAAEAGKIISCEASIITMFLSYGLLGEMHLRKTAVLSAFAIAAFLPEHILLAGRLNNDSLAVMFMTAVILYTIRWHRTRALRDLIILSFSYGLGMMTKMSVGALAPVTGVVMLLVFLENVRSGKQFTGILLQYLLFAAIAFPLGLWFPVRNHVLFGQPIFYVFPIGTDSPLYTGGYSLLSRFGPWLDFHVYADPYRDFNVWLYLMRTAVFGEFSYGINIAVPSLLLIYHTVMALTGTWAGVYFAIKRPSFSGYVLGGFYLALMLSYIVLNLKYPFGCSMDFRYVVPAALIGAVFYGKLTDIAWGGEIRRALLVGIEALFCMLSCWMYTAI
ncbi:MAG: glycosyltransferase family 39 protein [Lachnospiraceae bacterium]|nr:glycosyltransferase family 39 protein [Lachnospiraceae bacterium]